MLDWKTLLGNTLLFALVFGMSATVDVDCIKTQAKNCRALFLGIFCQFIVLPLLGFMVVRTLQLPEPLGLTLLVVTSSPGGSYSNWWCSMFNADLALSVTMTALSTCLSTVMLPANLLLYTRASYHHDVVSSLDWHSLFVALAVVMVAIVAGLCSSAYSHSNAWYRQMANHLGT